MSCRQSDPNPVAELTRPRAMGRPISIADARIAAIAVANPGPAKPGL